MFVSQCDFASKRSSVLCAYVCVVSLHGVSACMCVCVPERS